MNVSEVISQTPTTTVMDVNVTPGSPEISSSNMGSVSTDVATPVKAGADIPWEKIIRYGLIVLILAFLGFNIFTALSKATDTTAAFLKPVLAVLGYGVGETVKQTTDVAAEGAKGVVDVAAGTVDNAVTLMEKSVGVKGVEFNRVDKANVSTSNALASATNKLKKSEPEADEAGSSTQQGRALPKSGYCYIGEDRGFRSCIKVNEGDMCMSGEIFPTKDVCVNPSLRE
jgi:hypothetical protein